MKKAAIFGLAVLLVLSVCACSSSENAAYTVGDYTVDAGNGTISDGTNVYRYTFSGSASGYRIEITYPDGSAYWRNGQRDNGGIGFSSSGWSEDYDETRYARGDVLCDILAAGAPGQKEAKPGKFLIVLLLLALGAFNIASPQTAWYLSEGWKFRDAEPSGLALGLARMGGIGCCIVAVIVILAW